MIIKNISLIILVLVILFSCAAPPPQERIVYLSSEYRDSLVDWSKIEGTSSVTGSAFLRQRNGAVQTCAAYEVMLVPFTDYADERMRYIYNGYAGLNNNVTFLGNNVNNKFQPDHPSYQQGFIKSVCDQSGNFKFSNVASGDYFLVATVVWESVSVDPIFNQVGTIFNGGALMKKISVQEGTEHNHILTIN